jgi:hypothetical protein
VGCRCNGGRGASHYCDFGNHSMRMRSGVCTPRHRATTTRALLCITQPLLTTCCVQYVLRHRSGVVSSACPSRARRVSLVGTPAAAVAAHERCSAVASAAPSAVTLRLPWSPAVGRLRLSARSSHQCAELNPYDAWPHDAASSANAFATHVTAAGGCFL